MIMSVNVPILGAVKMPVGGGMGIRLWNADIGKEIILQAPKKSDPDDAADIVCAAFNTDGKRVLVGSRKGTVSIFSADDGKVMLRFNHRNNAVRSLAVSRDDQRLLLVYDDGTLEVCLYRGAAAMGGGETRTWPPTSGGVRSAIWSGDNQRVFVVHGKAADSGVNDRSGPEISQAASNPQTQTISILDIATGSVVGGLKGHEDDVTALDLSPDGSHLVTASLDGNVRIWHANEGPAYGTVFRG